MIFLCFAYRFEHDTDKVEFDGLQAQLMDRDDNRRRGRRQPLENQTNVSKKRCLRSSAEQLANKRNEDADETIISKSSKNVQVRKRRRR